MNSLFFLFNFFCEEVGDFIVKLCFVFLLKYLNLCVAMEHPKIQKQAKKSWIAYLAPVYAFAICAYVLFMVYRITTKQVTVQ